MCYTVDNEGKITFVNTTDSLKFIRYRCNKCGKQFTLITWVYGNLPMFVNTDDHKCEEAAHSSRVYITPIEESFIPFEDDKELVKKQLSGEIVCYNDKYYYNKDICELKYVVEKELPNQDSKVIFILKDSLGEPVKWLSRGVYNTKKKRWYDGFNINVVPSYKTKDIYAWNLLE